MLSLLLISFVVDSSLIFGGFSSKFLTCCFHRYIRSSWLAAFSFAVTLLFLLLASFTVCQATQDCLSSTESLILLVWFCMYSDCSFRYAYINSFCSFLSIWVLILFGFLLLHKEAIFTSVRFFLTDNVSHGTLGFVLCLGGMHSAAVSKWALTKFSYSLLGVCASDNSWSASNFFLSFNVYLSLL